MLDFLVTKIKESYSISDDINKLAIVLPDVSCKFDLVFSQTNMSNRSPMISIISWHQSCILRCPSVFPKSEGTPYKDVSKFVVFQNNVMVFLLHFFSNVSVRISYTARLIFLYLFLLLPCSVYIKKRLL